MEGPATECVQALQALYSSPDQTTQKQADAWLTRFQQSPAAWQVCDQILSHAETPVQYRFFAAQTMRTKVQFDFYELPPDSYASLRNTLLNHVDKFRAPDCQPIHTQLAMAVADLAIQLDNEWPDVIDNLFQKYGQNADSYASLLEILRLLPEENHNHKLMTDTQKRYSTRDRFTMQTGKVVQFLLTLQCPNVQAKKKVLECFLSWMKFAENNMTPGDMAQNPMLPECFKFVVEGGDLSETATDIIIEVLRMSSRDLQASQAIIQVIFSLLPGLYHKFQALLQQGPDNAVNVDPDGLQQICRIYVELAECMVPLIMEQSGNPEVMTILKVMCQCTDLPNQEISAMPLDVWHRLANEIARVPENDAKIDQFKGLYVELLGVAIRRCTMPNNMDPFQADDDAISHRSRLLSLAEDCLEVLTPNTALEHVLQSLQKDHRSGISVQEAHFFILTAVAPRAEVQESSVLWQLIQSLPPLIKQNIDQDTTEAALLHFTKKTAIELLGCLCSWLRTRPELFKNALEMISIPLLNQALPATTPQHILERTKQVQQSASMAFKDICIGGRHVLQDIVQHLVSLYVQTMSLPIRMHLFIVDGVSSIAALISEPEAFKSCLEQLVTPLIQGLNSERERPNVLAEILDRLVTIIQKIKAKTGSAIAATTGALITNTFWPAVQQTLQTHPGDPKVVEKSCRLLKHSMRCVQDLFKPIVTSVAQTLIQCFQTNQHSSYLYSAEILANTYANDPEIVPVLTHLFQQLSGTGLQCVIQAKEQNQLENITELVEDFYGMFERYLRYAPKIVLEAPTLAPTLQLWHAVIFVQQKDAIEAIIAFIEAVLGMIAEAVKVHGNMRGDPEKAGYGQQLGPHVVQVMPGFMEALFKLIAGVPTRYVQEIIPCVLDGILRAFPQEFSSWLENAFQHIPPSVASPAEKKKLGEQLICGDQNSAYEAVQDLCYRCEQVALRNRAGTASTTNSA